MSDLPIELRCTIIDPAFFHPEQDIGIQIVIILQSARVASVFVRAFVAINSERTDSEPYPWFCCSDGLLQLLNETVHIVAPPVVPVTEGITCRFAVAFEALGIGKFFACHRIRIEIIVDMNRSRGRRVSIGCTLQTTRDECCRCAYRQNP